MKERMLGAFRKMDDGNSFEVSYQISVTNDILTILTTSGQVGASCGQGLALNCPCSSTFLSQSYNISGIAQHHPE
jgi:hypothetical protein